MGNSLQSLDTKRVKKFDVYLSQYPKLLNKTLLSERKLFKTFSFLVENESNIIMKVYHKRDNSTYKHYADAVQDMVRRFDITVYPNLLPFTKLIDEADFTAVVRPKVYLTLGERILTVPYLRKIEKNWIIF